MKHKFQVAVCEGNPAGQN